MAKNDSKLVTKVSPLIEGQVPDFVQGEHPLFVKFLKQYYQYLEAGRITYTGELDYLRQQTNTLEFILHEDGERVVTESGAGTTGLFVNGETITGSTSKATATVLVEDGRSKYLYISSQQKFITGETFTGTTSGATGVMSEYRANPVQNIQQLLEYANVDNTIYDFLDNMRDQFMTSIPETLATGVSKRNLLKNIKDLYAAKGTSEGHKLFFKAFLGEEPTLLYPTQYMMRSSDGNWTQRILLRVSASDNVVGDEVVNQVITGISSGATAIVVSSSTFTQGVFAVTEFELQSLEGTFLDGEIITATSITRDVDVTFTVSSQITTSAVSNDGILNSVNDTLSIESLGSGVSEVVVEDILTGSVSDIIVDNGGSLYEVGDEITFTSDSNDTDISSATGVVSAVGGGILQETGTLDNSNITTDIIHLEDASTISLVPFEIALEDGNLVQENITPDSSTTQFTLTVLNSNTDSIRVYRDSVELSTTDVAGDIVWSVSGTTLTFTTAPTTGIPYLIKGNSVNKLLLNSTSGLATNAGHNLLTDTTQETNDEFGTFPDLIVLEEDTFDTLAEATSIRKVQVTDGGNGYSKLPTLTITSTLGTSASLKSNTTDIGRANGIEIKDSSFSLDSNNPPDATFKAHFLLKSITGTFAKGNTLTTHTGTVSGWDANTQVLSTTFENVIRTKSETDSTNEGITLENVRLEESNILLEDELDFDDGKNFLTDATGTTEPTNTAETFVVKILPKSSDATANAFYINGVESPRLSLARGNTYIFDTSHSSLYNILTTANHQLLFASTITGGASGGTAYTTGVTQSSSATIPIGTTGSFIQIVVAEDAPQLYYYCANHLGMGNSLLVFTRPTRVDGIGDRLVINANDKTGDDGISLESGTERASGTDLLVQESGQPVGNAAAHGETSGGRIVIEHEHRDGGVPHNVGDTLAINRYRENGGTNYVTTEQGVTGNPTDRLSTEDVGNNLVQEDNEKILFEEDISFDNIVLDGTDSASVDAADDIINESPIDFSNNNVTITDSGGATATIVSADISTGSLTVDTQKTNVGVYSGIDSLVGEDLNRLQDSYYYQDYSYEVRVGESLSTYLNEMKKAVHPTGFATFGKVSIASQISARITATGAGVSGFDGDTTTFSPELASTFKTLFDEHIKISHRTAVGIQDHDQHIVLNGTDGSSTNAGDGILYEDGTGETGHGIIASEAAKGIGGESQRAIIHSREIRINSNPVSKVKDNVLLLLAVHPFKESCGITLESGSGTFADSLVLDGVRPFDDNVPFTLEDETGNICLETCRPGAGKLLAESDRIAVPDSLIQNENEKILYDLEDNDTTLTFNDVGDVIFEHILQPDAITISNSDANLSDSIVMENEGELLLDGTDNSQTDAGFHILQNTKETTVTEQDSGMIVFNGTDVNGADAGGFILMEDAIDVGTVLTMRLERDVRIISSNSKRETFILEETGVLISEDNDSTSVNDRIISDNLSESGGILMEDVFARKQNDAIKLEYGEGIIIMNGSGNILSADVTGSVLAVPYDEDAGFAVTFETEFRDQPLLAMETFNVIGSRGHIPEENFRLSSQNDTSYKSKYGYTSHVLPAEITVRTTGDIALEDATDTTHGYLVLDTAANAGQNIDLEGATGITF